MGFYEKHIDVWQLDYGVGDARCLFTFLAHEQFVYSLEAVSATWLASGSGDCSVRIWDLEDLESGTGGSRPLWKLLGHTATVTALQAIDGSVLLASASLDSSVRMWRLNDGECVHTLTGHTDFVLDLAAIYVETPSHNSRATVLLPRLASASNDGTVRLWNVASGQCVSTLLGHAAGVWSVDAPTSGDLLTSVSLDGTVREWRVASNATTCWRSFDLTVTNKSHKAFAFLHF